jgi:hypothetical protein
MKRTEALKQYEEIPIPHDKHVFEYDVNAFGKKCIVSTFDDFMDYNMNQKEMRVWNEHIRLSDPCRMFMDCEMDHENAPECIDLNKYVELIHSEVVKLVGEVDFPLIIQGSRKGKFSIHLIWSSLWCENIEPILYVAEQIKAMEIMNVIIDLGVYPTKPLVPKTLRMPFCGKIVNPSAGLMCPLIDGVKIKEFDPAVFCKYLLSFHSNHTTKGYPLPELPDKLYSLPKSVKRIRLVDGEQTWKDDGTVLHVLDWLEDVTPLFKRSSLRSVDNGGWKCYGTLYCNVAERWHKGNNTYVNCDQYGNIYFTCSDEDCRVSVRQKYSEHQHVVFDTKWNIDWSTINVLLLM